MFQAAIVNKVFSMEMKPVVIKCKRSGAESGESFFDDNPPGHDS